MAKKSLKAIETQFPILVAETHALITQALNNLNNLEDAAMQDIAFQLLSQYAEKLRELSIEKYDDPNILKSVVMSELQGLSAEVQSIYSFINNPKSLAPKDLRTASKNKEQRLKEKKSQATEIAALKKKAEEISLSDAGVELDVVYYDSKYLSNLVSDIDQLSTDTLERTLARGSKLKVLKYYIDSIGKPEFKKHEEDTGNEYVELVENLEASVDKVNRGERSRNIELELASNKGKIKAIDKRIKEFLDENPEMDFNKQFYTRLYDSYATVLESIAGTSVYKQSELDEINVVIKYLEHAEKLLRGEKVEPIALNSSALYQELNVRMKVLESYKIKKEIQSDLNNLKEYTNPECSMFIVDDFDPQNIEWSSLESTTCYVKHGEKLYYLSKLDNQVLDISIADKNKQREFDIVIDAYKKDQTDILLSDDQLKHIEVLTGYSRANDLKLINQLQKEHLKLEKALSKFDVLELAHPKKIEKQKQLISGLHAQSSAIVQHTQKNLHGFVWNILKSIETKAKKLLTGIASIISSQSKISSNKVTEENKMRSNYDESELQQVPDAPDAPGAPSFEPAAVRSSAAKEVTPSSIAITQVGADIKYADLVAQAREISEDKIPVLVRKENQDNSVSLWLYSKGLADNKWSAQELKDIPADVSAELQVVKADKKVSVKLNDDGSAVDSILISMDANEKVSSAMLEKISSENSDDENTVRKIYVKQGDNVSMYTSVMGIWDKRSELSAEEVNSQKMEFEELDYPEAHVKIPGKSVDDVIATLVGTNVYATERVIAALSDAKNTKKSNVSEVSDMPMVDLKSAFLDELAGQALKQGEKKVVDTAIPLAEAAVRIAKADLELANTKDKQLAQAHFDLQKAKLDLLKVSTAIESKKSDAQDKIKKSEQKKTAAQGLARQLQVKQSSIFHDLNILDVVAMNIEISNDELDGVRKIATLAAKSCIDLEKEIKELNNKLRGLPMVINETMGDKTEAQKIQFRRDETTSLNLQIKDSTEKLATARDQFNFSSEKMRALLEASLPEDGKNILKDVVKLADFFNLQINTLEGSIKIAKNDVDAVKKEVKQLKEQLNKNKATAEEVLDKQNKLESLESQLKDDEKRLEFLNEQLEKVDQVVSSMQNSDDASSDLTFESAPDFSADDKKLAEKEIVVAQAEVEVLKARPLTTTWTEEISGISIKLAVNGIALLQCRLSQDDANVTTLKRENQRLKDQLRVAESLQQTEQRLNKIKQDASGYQAKHGKAKQIHLTMESNVVQKQRAYKIASIQAVSAQEVVNQSAVCQWDVAEKEFSQLAKDRDFTKARMAFLSQQEKNRIEVIIGNCMSNIRILTADILNKSQKGERGELVGLMNQLESYKQDLNSAKHSLEECKEEIQLVSDLYEDTLHKLGKIAESRDKFLADALGTQVSFGSVSKELYENLKQQAQVLYDKRDLAVSIQQALLSDFWQLKNTANESRAKYESLDKVYSELQKNQLMIEGALAKKSAPGATTARLKHAIENGGENAALRHVETKEKHGDTLGKVVEHANLKSGKNIVGQGQSESSNATLSSAFGARLKSVSNQAPDTKSPESSNSGIKFTLRRTEQASTSKNKQPQAPSSSMFGDRLKRSVVSLLKRPNDAKDKTELEIKMQNRQMLEVKHKK